MRTNIRLQMINGALYSGTETFAVDPSTGIVVLGRGTTGTHAPRMDQLTNYFIQTIGTSGTINNLSITDSTKLLVFNSATELTGVIPNYGTSTLGRYLVIANSSLSSNNLIIRNNSASSTTTNRFDIVNDLTLEPGSNIRFLYNGSRWVLISHRSRTTISEATFVENAGGTAINVDSTFGGFTLQQIAQALINSGILIP
jgi:hypothetical protein